MFYGAQGGGNDAIFLATSRGGTEWRKWPQDNAPQPVLARGASNHVNDPSVVLVGGTYRMFTKVFAISEGLLPEDPRLDRVMNFVTLEAGLIVGLLLVLLGLAGSIYALLSWDQRSFGPLDPSRTLRVVIPAVTSLMLGCQILLSSFFLSILGLRRR